MYFVPYISMDNQDYSVHVYVYFDGSSNFDMNCIK
jgi:hypothetical protein